MTKYSALGILACLLAGCSTPQPAGTSTTVVAKHVYCEPATGSHIADPNNCGQDPFVRHTVITNANGSPLQTQGQ